MGDVARRAMLAGGAALVAAVGLRAPAWAQPAPTWSPRAPLPWAVQEVYAAVWRGRVVVAGGLSRARGGIAVSDRTGLYDPAADAWEEGPRLPEPRHHPMLVAAGGGALAFGGFDRGDGGDWRARTQIWALEDEDDRWVEAGRMPGPQCETVGAALNGRVHLVTGRAPLGARNARWSDHSDVADHYVFDPASGRWDTARPAAAPRNSAAGVVLDGALYVVGGRTVVGGNMARLDRYDPRADRWDSLSPLPQAAGGLAAGAARGRLWAFGGEWFGAAGAGVFPETWAYDPAADRWAAGPPMPTPRHGLAAAAVGEVVYALAGATRAGAAGAVGTVEALG